jgi:hypothetical protein
LRELELNCSVNLLIKKYTKNQTNPISKQLISQKISKKEYVLKIPNITKGIIILECRRIVKKW